MWPEQDSGGSAGDSPIVVVRNDWTTIPVEPDHDGPPTLSVSVVIPAYNCSRTLPYTLAALAHQDYPAHLLEVVVVDDGTTPPLDLPEVRPDATRLVRVPTGWGRANACHTGVVASEGEVVLFLDSDMVPFGEHVTEQLRWHHRCDDLVTIGHKLFVTDWDHVPLEDAVIAAAAGTLPGLYSDALAHEHWIEQSIADTDGLTTASHLAFRVFVGATGAMRRTTYDTAGGMDVGLRLGEDTELGYRLAQRGAVFVPVPSASSWHLGPPTVLTRGSQSRRWNRAFLANRMAYPRGLRHVTGRAWPVPLVRAVVRAADLETTAACVDRLLSGDEEDLQVDLVGEWPSLTDERRDVLADPSGDLYLLREWYRDEPRVRLVPDAPASVFPSPYRLDVPVSVGVGRATVRRLVAAATRHELGLVRVMAPGHGPDETLGLLRTAAQARAQHQLGADDDRALAAVWGLRWLDGATLGVVDLRQVEDRAAPVRWGRNTSRLQRQVRQHRQAARRLRAKLRDARDRNTRGRFGRRRAVGPTRAN